MRRTAVWVGACLLFAGAGLYVLYDPHPPGWRLTAAERADIAAGGWKDALEPIETIPVGSEQAAEEVAARLAAEYCSERETRRYEQHNTDFDYVKYVPACFEVDEPDHRLEAHSALVEVEVRGSGPPMLYVHAKRRPCMVNVGAQYEGLGVCVRDLLGRALKGSSSGY